MTEIDTDRSANVNNETDRALVTPSGDDKKKSSNASASSKGSKKPRASTSKAAKDDLSARAKYYQDMM